MSVTDYNNGLITGLALNGTIFINHLRDFLLISAIESNSTQLRVKYEDDTAFTVFTRTYDSETDTHTFTCTSNGAQVILTPMADEDVIYQRTEA